MAPASKTMSQFGTLERPGVTTERERVDREPVPVLPVAVRLAPVRVGTLGSDTLTSGTVMSDASGRRNRAAELESAMESGIWTVGPRPGMAGTEVTVEISIWRIRSARFVSVSAAA